MLFFVQGDNVLAERDSFSEAVAGSSRRNFWLHGLAHRVVVYTSLDATAVHLYSSTTYGDESNKFALTQGSAGVWTYYGVAGSDATSQEIAGNGDFEEGVKFYFRIKIVGQLDKVIDRIFWVRKVYNLVRFGEDKISYVAPFAVLVAALIVPVCFGVDYLNAAGVAKYGGAVTVEVLDTPSAPDSNYVVPVVENTLNNVAQIELKDRSSASPVPNFVPPPGSPDFSKYFHYVTFRFRSQQGSPNYFDYDTVLFGAQKCKTSDTSGYGFSGSGITTAPPLELYIDEEDFPPPICSSKTIIGAQTPYNPNSPQTLLRILDSPIPATANVLHTIIIDEIEDHLDATKTKLTIERVNLPAVTQPYAGYFQIIESSPDRESDVVEAKIYECSEIPLEDTETEDEGDNSYCLIGTGHQVEEDRTYTLEVYDQKYGGSLVETKTLDRVSSSALKVTIEENTEGWGQIRVDDDTVITTPRIELSLQYQEPGWQLSNLVEYTQVSFYPNTSYPIARMAKNNNRISVIYLRRSASTQGIFVARNYNGGSWGSEQNINGSPAQLGNSSPTDISMNKNGDYGFIFYDAANGYYGVIYDSTLGSFASNQLLSNNYRGGPAIAINNNKEALAIVGDNSTTAATYSREYNGTWGSLSSIAINGPDAMGCDFNDSKKGVVVYEDSGSNTLRARIYNSSWGSESTILSSSNNNGELNDCQPVVSESGKILVLHTDVNNKDLQYVYHNGTSWASPSMLAENIDYDSSDGQFAVSRSYNEKCLVCFVKSGVVYGAFFDFSTGSFGATTQVSDNAGTYRLQDSTAPNNSCACDYEPGGRAIVGYYLSSAGAYATVYDGSQWQNQEQVSDHTFVRHMCAMINSSKQAIVYSYTALSPTRRYIVAAIK